MKIADSTVNAMMAGIEADLGVSAKFEIWSGALPADESTTPAGAKLVTMALPSDYLTAPSAGVIAKNGTWTGAAAASGVGTFARLTTSAGVAKVQFTLSYASVAWTISTSVALNEKRDAGGNVYSCSQAGTTASSGSGPTGTGTAITDGTAKWDYVSAVGEATIDNANISATQVVTVTSISFTGPHL